MKELYHVGISSGGEEVLFRDVEDYHQGFNYLAIGLHKTESELFADAFMSTYMHWVVLISDLAKLVKLFKNSYGNDFNHKYDRQGPLVRSHFFFMPLKGIRHILAAESYVFRNAMHHGVSTTPFGYPHTSANCIFQKELGEIAIRIS